MKQIFTYGVTFLLLAGLSYAEPTSIVVLDFTPLNQATEDDGKEIADNIRLLFHSAEDNNGAPKYDQENYRRVEKAVTAAEKAGLDLRDLESLVRLGKAYPTEYMVTGSVSRDEDGKYYLTAEYIDVNAGEIIVGFALEGNDLRLMTSELINKHFIDTSKEGVEEFSVLFSNRSSEMTEEDYDSFRDIISVIASQEELAIYDILSSCGKELFLDKFWQRRDPYPDTTKNEFKDEFLERVAYSEDKFTTPFKKGYQTDLGKVYLKYGRPDEIEDMAVGVESVRSFEESEWQTKPYVAWKYYGKSEKKGNPALFVFEDSTGDGDYIIFASTENGYGKYISNFQEFDLNRLAADPFDTADDSNTYWEEDFKGGGK